MPRYVFNLIVGDQKYVIDDHGMEIDTLHEVHTNALRVLEHTFPLSRTISGQAAGSALCFRVGRPC